MSTPSQRAKHAENQRRYYYKANSARRQNVARVNEIKRERGGCLFCNEKFSTCLEWHHKRHEEKRATVSDLARRASLEAVLKEIGKCVLICANCHRKLHTLLKCYGYGADLRVKDVD